MLLMHGFGTLNSKYAGSGPLYFRTAALFIALMYGLALEQEYKQKCPLTTLAINSSMVPVSKAMEGDNRIDLRECVCLHSIFLKHFRFSC